MRRSPLALAILATLLTCLSGLARAEDAAPDPRLEVIGRWTVTIDFNGRTSHPVLHVEADGEGLTGTWEGRRGEVPLLEVDYASGTLKARFERTFGEESTTLRLYADVDGDHFSGELETGQGSVPLTGVRETASD